MLADIFQWRFRSSVWKFWITYCHCSVHIDSKNWTATFLVLANSASLTSTTATSPPGIVNRTYGWVLQWNQIEHRMTLCKRPWPPHFLLLCVSSISEPIEPNRTQSITLFLIGFVNWTQSNSIHQPWNEFDWVQLKYSSILLGSIALTMPGLHNGNGHQSASEPPK